jgi:hypothetical protein
MITDTNKGMLAKSVRQPPPPMTPQLYTVKQFAGAYPAFTESSLRNLIFKSGVHYSSKGAVAGNGLVECGAIVRLGRRILIADLAFMAWVLSKSNDAGGVQPASTVAEKAKGKSSD